MGMEQEKVIAEKAAQLQKNPSATPLFVISDAKTPLLALAITTVMAKARELKNEKGHYTVEYFIDEMLAEKLKSFSDYLDSNEERKERELYVKAMNALPSPDGTFESLKKHYDSTEALARRYRQGAYKPKKEKS